MAGEQIKRQQHNVHEQHQRAHADAEMQLLIGAREPEGPESVIPEEAQEYDRAIEKVAMEVLQDEREFRFAAIVAVRALTHGARGWVHEERAVEGLAIVIAGHTEAQRKS